MKKRHHNHRICNHSWTNHCHSTIDLIHGQINKIETYYPKGKSKNTDIRR